MASQIKYTCNRCNKYTTFDPSNARKHGSTKKCQGATFKQEQITNEDRQGELIATLQARIKELEDQVAALTAVPVIQKNEPDIMPYNEVFGHVKTTNPDRFITLISDSITEASLSGRCLVECVIDRLFFDDDHPQFSSFCVKNIRKGQDTVKCYDGVRWNTLSLGEFCDSLVKLVEDELSSWSYYEQDKDGNETDKDGNYIDQYTGIKNSFSLYMEETENKLRDEIYDAVELATRQLNIDITTMRKVRSYDPKYAAKLELLKKKLDGGWKQAEIDVKNEHKSARNESLKMLMYNKRDLVHVPK